jgi:UDP-N-acetylglucosamine 2-epimerase (non-hydrolysing)
MTNQNSELILTFTKEKYFLLSTHREENVDHPENLTKILNILNLLAEINKLPVIVSTHPEQEKELNN